MSVPKIVAITHDTNATSSDTTRASVYSVDWNALAQLSHVKAFHDVLNLLPPGSLNVNTTIVISGMNR